jgi:hypothetical protein
LDFAGAILLEHWALTVAVANELVEIDLGIHLVAISVTEPGPEDVAVVDTDVRS